MLRTAMHGLAEPSEWITRFAPAIEPASRVLDLACGAGRHTRLFLRAGHRVTAVDVDITGLADLTAEPDLRLIEADLEDGSSWPLGTARFDAVIVTNYLHRPVFHEILAAVDDGGLLLYETYARGNERFGKPRNPAFLLEPGELLDVARGELQVIAFEQGIVARGKETSGQAPGEAPGQAVVQRICAVRSDDGEMPFRVLPDTG